MSIEEVESAVTQAEVTSKFRQSVLTEGAYDFLISGGDNLSKGLDLPFTILSSVLTLCSNLKILLVIQTTKVNS